MKFFRYLMFLSILSGIFVLIYRQSDEKGFCRWWISFKIAVLTAAIAAGLIPLNTEAIESPANNNQVCQERLLSEQEFNSLKDNDSQIILAKSGGNPATPPTNRGPSNFPTSPARGRPSQPMYVPKYRPAPKIVPGPGLGGGANPAGAGGDDGAAEFDDGKCPAPNKEQSEAYDYRSNDPKKKKKKRSAEQSELEENSTDKKIKIVSKIKEDAGLVRAAEEACRDAKVQKDINHLEGELAKGNDNPGIHRKYLGNGIIEHRGRKGGRLYVRESGSVIEILAKSSKRPTNQQYVINRLKEIYG